MLLVNGQYPGPTIEADWGDYIEVTVTNGMENNGTSIHWHGFRQYKTNTQDGTNGVTECPLAPGQSKTYRFQAAQYGTSWYHSHYSMQYADGVVGPIIIHGPTTANWDVDTAPITLTDWFYTPSFPLYDSASVAQGPPTADNVLIGGKMTSAEGGEYYVVDIKKGKKNLLHFVNTGINAYLHVSLDNHKFQVVGADFVPVKPFVTDNLVLGVGQRYDVIVDANQKVDNYWLRVNTGGAFGPPQQSCDGPNANEGNIKAIVRYNGAKKVNPTSTNSTAAVTGCYDLPGVTPYVKTTVPSGLPKDFEVSFTPANSDGAVVQWLVNSSAINIDWDTPTLKYVEDGTKTFPKSDNVVLVNGNADKWTYWVLHQDANNPPLPHPIHLHGHDFWVLAQGNGTFDGTLSLNNPVRRDTATLPAAGHLVLAFPADNPGAWLMHCHIPFHISGGLGLQFLERRSDILKTVGSLSQFDKQCKQWTKYTKSSAYVAKDDSGL
jgi:FtsP/CotA-like multicopper oxidase with cupredoxin domain